MTIEYRRATLADLPQMADRRWRLRVGDKPVWDRNEYDRFVADFTRICQTEWQPGEIVHWIAADGDRVVGIISVAIIRALPSPENLHDCWGYISNTYVLPELRDAGIGQLLMSVIKDWARCEDLELLVVWPSERAYPFYERTGFSRLPDPLVLKLRSE